MSLNLPSIEEAANTLKNIVKMSNIDDQKHLDLTLVNADERMKYQTALAVIQNAVKSGEITQLDANEKIGL